jgi:predicted PP-loop superfamily ATPase
MTRTTNNDASATAEARGLKVRIFGANLRDQSKGVFVVHAADCADCKKLAHETSCIETHESALSISKSIWGDMIDEGSMTVEDGLMEIHFAPCVKFARTHEPINQHGGNRWISASP